MKRYNYLITIMFCILFLCTCGKKINNIIGIKEDDKPKTVWILSQYYDNSLNFYDFTHISYKSEKDFERKQFDHNTGKLVAHFIRTPKLLKSIHLNGITTETEYDIETGLPILTNNVKYTLTKQSENGGVKTFKYTNINNLNPYYEIVKLQNGVIIERKKHNKSNDKLVETETYFYSNDIIKNKLPHLRSTKIIKVADNSVIEYKYVLVSDSDSKLVIDLKYSNIPNYLVTYVYKPYKSD